MTAVLVALCGLSALMLLLALVLPAVTDPTVPFGVRVPAQYAADPSVGRQTRAYRVRVVVGDVVAAGFFVVLYGLTSSPALLPLSVLVLLCVWYGCFFLAHYGIRAAKVAGGWYEGQHEAVAVDTGLRTDPPRFPWAWLAPALIVTVATAATGVIRYPSMPARLVVHYTGRGVPNRVVAKSVGTAFSLVFVQVAVTALLVGIALAIYFRTRSDVDPARPLASARWHRRYMSVAAKVLLGLAAMIDLGMAGSSLLMWTGTVTRWAPLVVAVPVLTAVVVAIVILARNNRDWNPGDEDTGLVHRDDDQYWRGGLFYVNREDHALMVPRRFGLGWTLNFGNPVAAMLLAAVAALIGLLVTVRFGG